MIKDKLIFAFMCFLAAGTATFMYIFYRAFLTPNYYVAINIFNEAYLEFILFSIMYIPAMIFGPYLAYRRMDT